MANLLGQKFGRLTVIEKTNEKKNGSIVWICQCDCGNLKRCSTRDLRSPNHAKSCGCLQKERTSEVSRKDITGLRSGKLVALEPTDKRYNNSIVWKCQCDCGNIHYVSTPLLIANKVQSCGCVNSKGNQKIKQLLQIHQILHIPEYPVRINGINYFFDFAILNDDSSIKAFIEYDGIQHFEQRSGWDNLKKVQLNDNIKNSYCIEKNIPLLRIPYTEFDKINIDYLERKIAEICIMDQ